MTVQNGRCRDGGWEDAAGRRMGGRDGTADGRTRLDGGWEDATGRRMGGRGGTATGLPLFWTSPKERSRETTDAAGRWKGWRRDGATEGLLKVMIFREI